MDILSQDIRKLLLINEERIFEFFFDEQILFDPSCGNVGMLRQRNNLTAGLSRSFVKLIPADKFRLGGDYVFLIRAGKGL